MKLWHIWRIGLSQPDEACGFVVRAKSAHAARRFAADNAGDEGSDVWIDTNLSHCEVLKAEGKPGVVLTDFHEG